jgi:glycosyltransferase involved in cell wall biosynthesis
LFTRLISTLELGRTARYEAHLVRTFDHTVITSPKDREGILALEPDSPKNKVSVISHGVDLDYYHPNDSQPRRPASLVLSGKMSYHANVAMAHYLMQEIMPLLWAQRPDLELIIVGKDPPASIQEYAKHPQVQVTGTVPDVRPYLQQATLAVAPLRYAVGIQNKVLEAMACATPVVTTPQVLTSISAKPGIDIMIGEDASGFAQAVLALLADPQRRSAMQTASRRYVEENHSWERVTEKLEQVYQSAIDANHKP